MQTIEVTEEQYRFVTHLREAISEDLVGRYGHVRERDAIQYLIDNLDGDVTTPEDAGADPTAAETSEDDEEISRVSYDESDSNGGEDRPDDEDEVSGGDDESGESAEEGSVDGDATAGVDGGDEDGDGPNDDGPDDDGSNGDGPNGDGAAKGEPDGAADDDDMLNEMMSLLETHENKWEEATSSDYRYSVELPDGTVEDVQTKDDVRALLFRHYR